MIDWEVMDSYYWNDTDEDPNRKARRQAELLVYGEVGLDACLGFAVHNAKMKESLERFIEQVGVEIGVGIRPQFYF